jgi:UDP-glucose 4-epimerase
MANIKTVLVTGGLGYIGSHTVCALVEKGYDPIIVDDLVNTTDQVLPRLEKITGKRIKFYQADVCSHGQLDKVFKENKIDAIIHFAGLKAVGESVFKPVEYYRNNLDSTLTLLEDMTKFGVKNIIFSSSATVYGAPTHVPLTESDPIGTATNPYGTTKIIQEGIFQDFAKVHPDCNIALLRYFNPIGAHPSGLIGDSPNGIPNNLMPYITEVAVKKLPYLSVYGNDYPTKDGTCIRDYVHVCDLAEGHVLTLNKLATDPGIVIYNLGTGKGTSVFELIAAYQKATGVKIPYKVVARRPGDVPANFASTEKAEKELGFKAKFTIEDCCRDANHWQQMNPDGYGK